MRGKQDRYARMQTSQNEYRQDIIQEEWLASEKTVIIASRQAGKRTACRQAEIYASGQADKRSGGKADWKAERHTGKQKLGGRVGRQEG